MGDMSVRSVSVDEIGKVAEKARECGAKKVAESDREQPGPLLQKLLDNVNMPLADKKEEKKAPKVVHLVSNLPPLPSRLVEMIQEKSFVDFAWFPVFEEGPSDGEWSSAQNNGSGGLPAGLGTNTKRRGLKEVPDVLWWGTCFSLFQVAWARVDPSMWNPLMAYREIIMKMARRHRWEHVAKYDRRFRQEAAGKTEVKWEEEKMNLIFDIVYSTSDSKGDAGASKQSGAGNVTVPRREQKRRGACYRFNRMNGSCVYGTQCRFAHVCSQCGGEHTVMQCQAKSVGKGSTQGASGQT